VRKCFARAFLVLPFVVVLLAIAVYGQDELQTQLIGPPFLGLNNVDDPYTLQAGKAQDLLNIDLVPDGKSVKKRKGYGLTWQLAITTTPVRGVYNFFNEDGDAVNLFFNDTRGAASINGTTPAVLFSTGPNGAIYQCVDAAGFAYCANTIRTSILKIDGSNDDTITTMRSTGTMLAITPERLVHAGFSGDPSRIDFSAANDFRTWTLGGDPEDPISFTIVSPGAKITHIVYAHSRIYWFKTNSFGFILEGATHDDWVARTLNPEVGTLFNTSIFRNDILYFQGQDSHWYSWDGSNLEKLSRNIDAEISAGSLSQISNSITQTTAADFNSGSILPRIYVDTQTASNSIQMTYPDDFSAFRDGTSGTKNVWTETNTNFGNASVDSGYIRFSDVGGTNDHSGVSSVETISGLNQGTTISIVLSDIRNTTGVDQFHFGIANNIVPFNEYVSGGSNFRAIRAVFRGSATGVVEFQIANTPSTGLTVGMTTSTPFTIELFIKQNYLNFTINKSSSWASGVFVGAFSDTVTVYMGGRLFNSLRNATSADNFTVVPQTVTYQSVVNTAPTITNWGTIDVTKQDNGGTQTIYLRSSLEDFSVNSGTPAWTQVTPGQTISISTGDYFQFRNDFAITNGTQTPRMDDFTINWTENNDQESEKTWAIYHKDALWWSVKSGAGVTTNNRIFKLDLLNNEWLKYDTPANGFLVYNKELYFGGVSTGCIFQFGTREDDNGTAINAYWRGRPFFGTDPFLDRDFWDMSFVTAGDTGSNLSVTYTLNGSTATAFSVPLSHGSDAFVKRNVQFPLGTVGSTIDFQFGNNAADQPFELFGAQFKFKDKVWNPED